MHSTATHLEDGPNSAKEEAIEVPALTVEQLELIAGGECVVNAL